MAINAWFGFVAVAAFAGCAHAPGGFMIQRGDNVYELFVGGAVSQKEDSFFHGAFEICRKNHNSGFEVSKRSSDGYASVEATITCKGKVDKFMSDKYRGATIQLERSDIRYNGGYRFHVVPASK
ncbi:MAG: hypothetical protein A2X94_01060 [Bdellovibrionales bacterium GWB1_55_8]|nr:MAG: hypothetical protein A2X94_01060 [Bdellovibrionales bacterium GWB1_55_8]